MLVENTVQQLVVALWIGAQFLIGVQDSSVLVVAVQFEYIAATVGQGLRASERVSRSNHRWFDPLFTQGVFHESIKVGGNDNSHVTRSEEHTSEYQSLMRISYGVLCLK